MNEDHSIDSLRYAIEKQWEIAKREKAMVDAAMAQKYYDYDNNKTTTGIDALQQYAAKSIKNAANKIDQDIVDTLRASFMESEPVKAKVLKPRTKKKSILEVQPAPDEAVDWDF